LRSIAPPLLSCNDENKRKQQVGWDRSRKGCHCEPQSGVAIRIPCDAQHRPAPEGAGKRTDCHGLTASQ